MKTKIENLTPRQMAQFPEYIRRWTDIGLSTESADRPRAESAIVKMYGAANLPPPHIVWCGSPLSNAITREIVKGIGNSSIGAPVRASVRASVWASVWASVGASVRDSVRASVRDSVRASVWASVRASVWASVWDSVGASVRDSVRASVWASVWASVRDSVGDSVWDSVGASVRDSVWASVGASVRDSVWASVGASVRDSVGASVRDSVRASVWASVWASVRDSVGDSVWDSVGASVRDSVWASVGASVRDSVWDSVGASVRDSVFGQHDANWIAFYAFFREECGLTKQTELLQGLTELTESAGWAIPHERTCWVSERHSILNRNTEGRLHCETGPSLAYPDGWQLWHIHGVAVDGQIVMRPETQTVAQIAAETNEEIKRVRIDRFGWERWLKETNARRIDERHNDRDAQNEELYEDRDGRRRILVNDPSTGRRYALGCPRTVKSCEDAQAFISHGLDALVEHAS